MRNCLKADILRVQKKKAYIIMTSFVLFIIAIAGITSLILGSEKGPDAFHTIISAAFGFNSLLLGIPVFSAVIGDDFKSRSMQTVIGRGLSREKLIYARLIEIIIIVIEAYIVFDLAVLIFGLVGGVDINLIGTIIRGGCREMLNIIGFTSVSMIFAYWTQNGTLALVAYILLGASVFDLLISAISFLPGIRNTDINIGDYVITGMVGHAVDATSFGKGLLWFVFFVLVWVCLPTFIAVKAFKHKELDF
jgi:hypothetical protein